MKIIEKKELREFEPICPHCENALHEIVRISDDKKGFFQGLLGYCYACPHCKKVLGFADYQS